LALIAGLRAQALHLLRRSRHPLQHASLPGYLVVGRVGGIGSTRAMAVRALVGRARCPRVTGIPCSTITPTIRGRADDHGCRPLALRPCRLGHPVPPLARQAPSLGRAAHCLQGAAAVTNLNVMHLTWIASGHCQDSGARCVLFCSVLYILHPLSAQERHQMR
jgi:hypothetical protein